MFDIGIVEEFSRKIQPYPVGTIVKLSNGLRAIVVKNMEGRGTRPLIRVFKDGDKKIKPFMLDLWDSETRSITIIGEAEEKG